LIHEESIQVLPLIKEISPGFYDRLVNRVANVNSSVHTLNELSQYCNELPPYFNSWKEYVYYLADNITQNGEKIKRAYDGYINRLRKKVGTWNGINECIKILSVACCKSIIAEDFELKKVESAQINVADIIRDQYLKIKKENEVAK